MDKHVHVHLICDPHRLSSSTVELFSIVRLQDRWRSDEGENVEQRERDGGVALGCQSAVVIELDAMVLTNMMVRVSRCGVSAE